MDKFDDVVLREMYVNYGIPCDRLVSNPETLLEFVQDYQLRTGQETEAAKLAHHLLNLRRRGEDGGGLPRLCRCYAGRNLN